MSMKDPLLVPNSFTAEQMTAITAAVKDRLAKFQASYEMAVADKRDADALDTEWWEALAGKCEQGTKEFVLEELPMMIEAVHSLQRLALRQGKFRQAGDLGVIETKLKTLRQVHTPADPAPEPEYEGPARHFNVNGPTEYRRPLCGQVDSSGRGPARTRYTVVAGEVTCKKCAAAVAKRAASTVPEACQ